MRLIKYVGKRPDYPDCVADTGLVWTRGQVHPVDNYAASQLLQHPGNWVEVGLDDPAAAEIDPEALGAQASAFLESKRELHEDRDEDLDPDENPDPMPNINSMTKGNMVKLAKTRFNYDLDPDAMKADEMRERLIQLERAGRRPG